MTSTTDRLSTALAGRYRIERHLGEGGMASVYLAEDVRHDRKVAVKVLKPELAAVLGADRFVQEIKTTASLQHPHILPLFDSGVTDGFLFYVMPYIQGETLREKLNRERQLGVEEAVRIAREVAEALDYAHRHAVIHRDIKPENILLHDGRPMVADFGIALAVSAAAGGRMTETGLSLGTPYYMSPEQATAERDITARSDIYSLGSVLYEMLTGTPPHVGATAQQIIMRIITDEARPVTELRKSVPAHVAAAVAKALEKLPADRFESAKAFSDALGNAAFTATPVTRTVASPSRSGREVPLSWFIAASTSTALAIVVAALAWRRPEPVRAVSRFSLQMPDSQAISFVGNVAHVTISPDGRTIVYVGAGATPSSTRLWARALGELQARPLAGTDLAGNPSFSPDGKRIAFVSLNPQTIKTVSLTGGPVLTLVDSLVDLGGVSWGSDGYIYYDGRLAGDGVARVRETGGKPEQATHPDSAAGERYHNIPSALPNGRGLLFTIARAGGPDEADVAVLDAKTGNHKVLARGVAARYAASGHLVYVQSDGTMMATTFDLDRLEVTGAAVPIEGGVAVRTAPGTQRVDVSLSNTGSLLYTAGSARGRTRELVRVSREGAVNAIDPRWNGLLIGRASLSPDARSVAVSIGSRPVDQQVWVKRLPDGPATKIADVGSQPSWSPDGRMLLFSTPSSLQTVPADGSALPTTIRSGVGLAGAAPTYTKDGKWIVFGARGDLYAMRTDGDTALRELVTGLGLQAMASVSPDGRWLAYQSNEAGRPEVFVRPFPDTKTAKRQVSTSGGAFPRWSRDGRELFFMDQQTYLIAVPVTPGPVFVAGVAKQLFPVDDFGALQFEVSADGKQFVMTRVVGGRPRQPDELILVQNFFEELKAKVKRSER